jgi:hypothetical protein
VEEYQETIKKKKIKNEKKKRNYLILIQFFGKIVIGNNKQKVFDFQLSKL